MTLGERIKDQRIKCGFSQEKIAELVGISRQAVTKWESGQSVPSMANLITLAKIFGVPLGELTGGVNDHIPVVEDAVWEGERAMNKNMGTAKLIFAIVLAVIGIMAVIIISNMNALAIVGLFGVPFHSVHLVRLGFQVGGGMAIFAAVVLFVLYIKGCKTTSA